MGAFLGHNIFPEKDGKFITLFSLLSDIEFAAKTERRRTSKLLFNMESNCLLGLDVFPSKMRC